MSIGPPTEQPGDEPDELEAAGSFLPLPMVPPELSGRLRSSFDPTLRRIVGKKLADSREGEGLVGVRGGAATAWTVSYSAGPCDVVIDIAPEPSGFELDGQLLCPEPTAAAVVRVFADDELIAATTSDEFGQFRLRVGHVDSIVVAARTDHDVIDLPLDLGGD